MIITKILDLLIKKVYNKKISELFSNSIRTNFFFEKFVYSKDNLLRTSRNSIIYFYFCNKKLK